MARRRRVGLNSRDLAELSREIHAQAQGIRGGATAGAVRLCEEVGLPTATKACRSTTVAATIHVERTPRGAALVAEGERASYEEFGVGIVGKLAGFPTALDEEAAYASDYQLDGMGNGYEGWFYPVGDGTYRKTWGQPGSGFMAKAGEAMRREGATVIMSEMVSGGRADTRENQPGSVLG